MKTFSKHMISSKQSQIVIVYRSWSPCGSYDSPKCFIS